MANSYTRTWKQGLGADRTPDTVNIRVPAVKTLDIMETDVGIMPLGVRAAE